MTLKERKQNKYHQEILDAIEGIREEIRQMGKKVDPMYEIFGSVQGFNGVAVWIMKILAGIGVTIGGIYAIIEFFKRLAR